MLAALFRFGIFQKKSRSIVGAVGVGEHDDLHEPELFYQILTHERGRGYAKEAAKAVTNWALTNYKVPYLIGTVGRDNIASQKVLEHCGFQYINDQTLLVHIENREYKFRYYRSYRTERTSDL